MRTIFITGESRGIGRAIADLFREKGEVVIAPKRQELDLGDEGSIRRYSDSFNQKVDVFVHCAGINDPKPFAKIEPKDLMKTLQINTLAFYELANHFVKNDLLVPGGYILGISSIYGSLSRRGRFSYVTSKHALHGMIKTLALELGEKNIKVNALSPGFIDTELTRKNNSLEQIQCFKEKIPLGRLGDVKDIAKTAYFLCSSDNAYINGQNIIIDGGYSVGGFEK